MRGAYLLTDSTDSIESPPDAPVAVVNKEIPDVTVYSVVPCV